MDNWITVKIRDRATCAFLESMASKSAIEIDAIAEVALKRFMIASAALDDKSSCKAPGNPFVSNRSVFSEGAYGAVLYETGRSEKGIVTRRYMQRKYRATCRGALLAQAAVRLRDEGLIEIMTDISGRGRPAVSFKKIVIDNP